MGGAAGAGAGIHSGSGGDGKEQNRRLSLDGDLPAEAVGPLEGATTGGSGGRGGGSSDATGGSPGGSEGILEFRREAVMLPIDVGACSSAGWEPGRRGVLGSEGMQVRKENQVRLGFVRLLGGRTGRRRCEPGGGGLARRSLLRKRVAQLTGEMRCNVGIASCCKCLAWGGRWSEEICMIVQQGAFLGVLCYAGVYPL